MECPAVRCAPSQHVCLFEEIRHSRVVVDIAATKEEARVETLHRSITPVPLPKIHLSPPPQTPPQPWAPGQ